MSNTTDESDRPFLQNASDDRRGTTGLPANHVVVAMASYERPDHAVPFCCVRRCGPYLLDGTTPLSKCEKFGVAAARGFLGYLSVFILAVLRIANMITIAVEYGNYKDWSTKKSTIRLFFVFASLLFVCSLAHIFAFYIFMPCLKRFTRNHERWLSLQVEITEWLGVVSDFLFLIVTILNFNLMLRDNCFRLGAKGDYSIMDEVITKAQMLIVLPIICLIGKAITAAMPADNGQGHKCSQKYRQFAQVFLLPSQLLAVVFAFCLVKNGLCMLAVLETECPEIAFRIQVDSHVRYVLDVRVAFPNPQVGVKHTIKSVDINYHSFLTNEKAQNPHGECESLVTDISETGQTSENYCNDGIYNYVVSSDTHHLGTKKGILLSWPCNVTSKLEHIRPGVKCYYRIKVQINAQSDFVYNYDYVYRLPESTNESARAQEWNRRSKYLPFGTFINSATESNFDVFRSLFKNVDKRLTVFKPTATVTDALSVLASEPHVLYIECNRTCFCYRCVAKDTDLLTQPLCFRLCPNEDINSFRNISKGQFCTPRDSDGCRSSWKRISDVTGKHNVKIPQVATFQTSPRLQVRLGKTSIAAEFDPSIIMESPEQPVELYTCVGLKWGGGLAIFLAAAMWLILYLCWQSKHGGIGCKANGNAVVLYHKMVGGSGEVELSSRAERLVNEQINTEQGSAAPVVNGVNQPIV